VKRTVLVLALLAYAACAVAAPSVAFRDSPEGILGGVPGGTSIAAGVSGRAWSASITRTLTPRLELTWTARPADLFDLEARALVVEGLLPLNVVVGVARRRVALECTLLLGPVHLNYGRSWGGRESRWGYVQYAFDQRLTLLVGLDASDGALGAILGVRVHPGQTRLWGASLLLIGGEIRVAVGGTL